MVDEKCIIRPANIDDYENVIKLFGKFVGDENRFKKPNDSFHKFVSEKNCFIDVAVINKKIIGFITYSIRTLIRYPTPILEVEEFFVLEDFRRLKIGTQLMDKAVETAKKNNCHYIFLASSKDRPDAHNFYKSLGFDEYAFHYRRKP